MELIPQQINEERRHGEARDCRRNVDDRSERGARRNACHPSLNGDRVERECMPEGPVAVSVGELCEGDAVALLNQRERHGERGSLACALEVRGQRRRVERKAETDCAYACDYGCGRQPGELHVRDHELRPAGDDCGAQDGCESRAKPAFGAQDTTCRPDRNIRKGNWRRRGNGSAQKYSLLHVSCI